MKKENTESKSDIQRKLDELTIEQQVLRNHRHKRNAVVNCIILAFYLALAIGSALSHAWQVLPELIGFSIWLGLVWFLEHQIVEQRYIINMQHGLHDLERQEIDGLMEAMSKQPSVKVVKKEKTNASANA